MSTVTQTLLNTGQTALTVPTATVTPAQSATAVAKTVAPARSVQRAD